MTHLIWENIKWIFSLDNWSVYVTIQITDFWACHTWSNVKYADLCLPYVVLQQIYVFFTISSECKDGTWNCTEDVCAEVGVIYGSVHIKTFDNAWFDIAPAPCAYIVVQVWTIPFSFLHQSKPHIVLGTCFYQCDNVFLTLSSFNKQCAVE